MLPLKRSKQPVVSIDGVTLLGARRPDEDIFEVGKIIPTLKKIPNSYIAEASLYMSLCLIPMRLEYKSTPHPPASPFHATTLASPDSRSFSLHASCAISFTVPGKVTGGFQGPGIDKLHQHTFCRAIKPHRIQMSFSALSLLCCHGEKQIDFQAWRPLGHILL